MKPANQPDGRNGKKQPFSVTSVAFRYVRCFLFLSVLAVPAFSQVPGMTHYQGSLRDKSGNPINASLPMTLSIYDTPTPGTGTQLWTENQTVGISNGVFSISVGAVNPIPASVFSSSSTYLEVDINGETPSAREQLLSGAYSFHSSVADTADYALTVSSSIAVSTINATASTPFGGVNITTNTFIQGSVGISSVPAAGNLFTVGAGTLTVTQSGNVGIGTASPTKALSVSGNASVTGTLSIGFQTAYYVCNGATCGAFSVSCPAGTYVVSGGCTSSNAAYSIFQSYPSFGSVWNCAFTGANSSSANSVYAICARLVP